MDPGRRQGAFEEHLKRYQSLAQLVLTLSTATIAYLVNFLVSISPNQPRTIFNRNLEKAGPWAIPLLGFSVLFAMAFIFLENLAYETYMHHVYNTVNLLAGPPESPYTGGWYALNLALGYSSVFLFFFSYVVLAGWLLHGRVHP
jgi:hypothetical protein